MSALISGLIRAYTWLPYSLIALFGRIMIGLVFHLSWRTKVDLATWSIQPKTFFLFASEYKVPLIPPEVAATMVTTIEFACPILLWIGLLTRPAATVLLGMVLVIQTFVYPQAYMDHALWAIGLLMLMRFGPGRISLDHLLKQHYVP